MVEVSIEGFTFLCLLAGFGTAAVAALFILMVEGRIK